MNASKLLNADPSFRVLVMGLPGSGKTTLTKQMMEFFPNATHLNADEVRKESNDWDFSEAGRIRQAQRMRDKADEAGGLVFADFVCPTPETRAAFAPHIIILMKTIEEGRFEDTNRVFVEPKAPDFTVTGWDYNKQDLYDLASIIARARPQGIMIGRYQPFHGGHKALLDKILEKHDMCCIMVRTVPMSDGNPLGLDEVIKGIQAELQDEKYKGRFSIMPIPNVAGVYYGRDVGYNVEQIELSAEIHAISATAIRKERGIKLEREHVQ